MVQGDVTVQLIGLPFTTTALDSAITSLRVSANDKWMMTNLDGQIALAHIEEA